MYHGFNPWLGGWTLNGVFFIQVWGDYERELSPTNQQLSNEKNPWLFRILYIGDYTTQLHGEYDKQL